MFKEGTGDWIKYRKLKDSTELDLHYSEFGRRDIPYWEAMAQVYTDILEFLKDAYQKGLRYVIFTHGSSTSRQGKTTARSQVRRLMRSRDATPYIIRNKCIQHESVFVAAVRPKPDSAVSDEYSNF
ncbi:MAG: hypothetical protein WC947_10245 [Elusimicrobiota bacterium]